MRKKSVVTLASVALLLAACSGLSLEEQIQSTEETINQTTSTFNQLFEKEQTMMEIYEAELETDATLENFNNESGALHDNLTQRQELIASIQEHNQAFEKATQYFTDYSGEDLSSETANAFAEHLSHLNDQLDAYSDLYLQAINQQRQYFNSFAEEDMDYEHLSYGVEVINETHERLYTQAQEINEQLEATVEQLDTLQHQEAIDPEADNTAANEGESAAHDGATDKATAEPKYVLNEDLWTIEPIEDSIESKVALLTIDDAPYGNALDMAETMQEKGVSAIFFVNGMYLDEDGRQVIQTLHDMGFEIGNHTQNHPNLSELTIEQQRNEIVETNDIIEETIGIRPRFFRAPFGVMNADTYTVLDEEGMTAMNWTYGYDWEEQYQNPENLTNIMVNAPELNHGANLLMHDRTWTRDALGDIIDGLAEKGYSFVNPSELTARKETE
ncbi:polysaccharide deacetylase family protein [Dolosigranulum pigrum]|uniref:polysaccharide deacetylase family protein n=1 Tax=Dolosigranulum pigrum TaxID=29394 RepID=UPI00191B4F26|nr:polysaccharide deacetylase family protein [Dolosigranulum pigrum]